MGEPIRLSIPKKKKNRFVKKGKKKYIYLHHESRKPMDLCNRDL